MEQDKREENARQRPAKTPVAEYLKAVRAMLRQDRIHEAYTIMQRSVDDYPGHPVLLSYYGWLHAVVEKKTRSGIIFCRRALSGFQTTDPHTAGTIYPILYLNLGRTLLLAGRKKEAIESFTDGLTFDRRNRELKHEMNTLGVRKKPLLAFLSRSHPLNKVLGKVLHTRARAVESAKH
ncbi:MAG: hypothetical protein M0042_14535 [Nitrospiraceae bacterium]|nr:hypothetical protein [Nitrospiraceae bacterium]